MIDYASYPHRRRVGPYTWHLTANDGVMIPSFAFGATGSAGWSSHTAFDSSQRVDAYDLSLDTRSFFDGTEAPLVPTVYTRTSVMPAVDAFVIANASVFRFRVIADVVATVGTLLDLTVGMGWSPSAATWASNPRTTRMVFGQKRPEYEFEIAKPAYMVTPAIAATSAIRTTFTSDVDMTAWSVSACNLYLIGWR